MRSSPSADPIAVDDVAPVALDHALARLQRLQASRRVFSNLTAVAGVDLSRQAIQVLRALDATQARSVADVARRARMDGGAVSRQLNALEDRRLATRAVSPSHGSVVLVTATSAGARLAARVAAVQRRHLVEALADWQPDERAALGRLLVRLVDDLERTPYRGDGAEHA
jgi:DNA-binding MarR family transcriptional regulator